MKDITGQTCLTSPCFVLDCSAVFSVDAVSCNLGQLYCERHRWQHTELIDEPHYPWVT